MILNFNLATFHWWKPSSTSLMIVRIFIISTLEVALANILRDVLVLCDVADVLQCNKVDFPHLLLLWAFFMTSFHSFSIVSFASGMNIAWDEKSFVCASRFPEASLRDRYPESSEPYVTLDSRSSLNRTTFGVHTSFSQVHTWEYLVLTRVLSLPWRVFVSQIRCAARRDNVCLPSLSKKN